MGLFMETHTLFNLTKRELEAQVTIQSSGHFLHSGKLNISRSENAAVTIIKVN